MSKPLAMYRDVQGRKWMISDPFLKQFLRENFYYTLRNELNRERSGLADLPPHIQKAIDEAKRQGGKH